MKSGPSLDDRAHRAWARTVKYYENLKVVYQIQTLLRDWQQQEDEQKAAPSGPQPKPDDRKLPVKGHRTPMEARAQIHPARIAHKAINEGLK